MACSLFNFCLRRRRETLHALSTASQDEDDDEMRGINETVTAALM